MSLSGKVTFFGSVGKCRCSVDLFTISKEKLFLKFWFCQVCMIINKSTLSYYKGIFLNVCFKIININGYIEQKH